MLIIISPAKTLNFESEIPKSVQKLVTQPKFLSQAADVATALKTKSKADLKKIYHVSDAIAKLNFDRYKNFVLESESETAVSETFRPAVFSFNGPAFKGFDAENHVSAKFIKHASQQMRILCGLYGFLRPYDLMQEYRLEMSNKFSIGKTIDNLYNFWGDQITDELIAEAKTHKFEFLANVASVEYSKVVNLKKLHDSGIKIINFKFSTDGRQATVYSKHARGLMARFIVSTQPKSVADLEKFDYEGYSFDSKNSKVDFSNTDSILVFNRKKPAPKAAAKRAK